MDSYPTGSPTSSQTGRAVVGFQRPLPSDDLSRFVDEVGREDCVRVAGGTSHWQVGRRHEAVARTVRAPSGVVEVQPAELIVRCGAGTTVAELELAVSDAGLQCAVDALEPTVSTVGGILSTGWSGVRRLRHGHVRDLLLEAQYVGSDGILRRAGAPVVKNVTGFDTCRLLVGSLGTLGLIGEVVLRCQPQPVVRRWFTAAQADPWQVRRALFRPSSILWDGEIVWVHIEGDHAEVTVESMALPGSWTECDAPRMPRSRSTMTFEDIRTLPATRPQGGWLAEIGTGTVHGIDVVDVVDRVPPLDDAVLQLNRKVKDAFDPTGRFNPGVLPW